MSQAGAGRGSRARVAGAALVAGLVVGACGGPDGDPVASSALWQDPDGGTFFVVQPVRHTDVMEALFTGRVAPDERGCVRLQHQDAPDDATVVWPYGFSLDRSGDGEVVRDDERRAVGRLGDRFRMGGGYVAELHDGLGFPEEDRREIQRRCPGDFWIVGEIP